jgi:hypothetical protein
LKDLWNIAYGFKSIPDHYGQYKILLGGVNSVYGAVSINREELQISIVNMIFYSIPTENIEDLAKSIQKLFLVDHLKYDEKISILFGSDHLYV